MSNNFFMVLPSNSASYNDNKTNKFRVRLPRKLHFEGNWLCGLHSIVYPNTWPSIGTAETQYLEIYMLDGGMLRVPLPPSSYLTAQELEVNLQRSIIRELQKILDEKGYYGSRILYYDDSSKRSKRSEEIIEENESVDEEEILKDVNTKTDVSSSIKPSVEPAKKPIDTKPSKVPTKETKTTELPAKKPNIVAEKKIVKQAPVANIVKNDKLPDVSPEKTIVEIIPRKKPKIQHKEGFKKGSFFTDDKDLAQRWVETEKKDWDTFKDLMEIEKRRWIAKGNDRASITRETFIKNLKLLAQEFCEEGSEFYNLLIKNIENFTAFYEILNAEDFEKDPNRYINIEKLKEENRTKSIIEGIKLEYLVDIGRFMIHITDADIAYIKFSDQLSYVLGFDRGEKIEDQRIAKYGCDVRGGVSHICCYINGVIEQMIVGNTLASLLQVVAISGKPGDIVEKKYDSPMFSKVSAREIDEIEIELRTLDGRLIPFDYGTVIITLLFKKIIVF